MQLDAPPRGQQAQPLAEQRICGHVPHHHDGRAPEAVLLRGGAQMRSPQLSREQHPMVPSRYLQEGPSEREVRVSPLPRSCELLEKTCLPTTLQGHSPPTAHPTNKGGVVSGLDTSHLCPAPVVTTAPCSSELESLQPERAPMMASDAPERAGAPSVSMAAATVAPFACASDGQIGTSTSVLSINNHVQSRPDLIEARLHRSTPKTPPRKKCEQCEALNPTARQARD